MSNGQEKEMPDTSKMDYREIAKLSAEAAIDCQNCVIEMNVKLDEVLDRVRDLTAESDKLKPKQWTDGQKAITTLLIGVMLAVFGWTGIYVRGLVTEVRQSRGDISAIEQENRFVHGDLTGFVIRKGGTP